MADDTTAASVEKGGGQASLLTMVRQRGDSTVNVGPGRAAGRPSTRSVPATVAWAISSRRPAVTV